jgi:formylmethanofuran dehydrogenase subunit E
MKKIKDILFGNMIEEESERSVKISSDAYNDILTIINAHPDNLTIDQFVNSAIKYKINRIRYNLENYDSIVSMEGILIARNERSFTKCVFCDKLFLNYTLRTKEGKRICQRCTKMIRHFAELV